jgi:hypothetical protein
MLGRPAYDLTHGQIDLCRDSPHFPHQGIGEKDLELLHGAMLSMDD